MNDPIRVLFMQSQTYFGADSMIHSLLMRYLNRERVIVHTACNPGTRRQPSAAINALAAIPDLHLRPTHFGPTITAQSKPAIAREVFDGTLPMLISLAGLARYIRKHRINILHGSEKPRDALYGVLLARLTGVKILIHVHVKPGDWMSPLTRWAMRHADGLLGVSAFVEEVLRLEGYQSTKIFHVHNSLDLSRWATSVNPASIREELNLSDNTVLLAIVSRLFPWKGHTQLLQAMAKVKDEMPDFRLLIVGEDDPRATPGGGSYAVELKRLVGELDLGDHIVFTGFRSDVPSILAACDIFAMPSFEEPFGMVYTEAMALRKPIIGLDGGVGGGGGTREVVKNGLAGLLSRADDIDQLSENILALMRNSDLRQRMGSYGRQRVEDYFNPKRMADETEQVYRQILRTPL